jgi:predicted Zn-ribbon and HTH transcriptional regulator
MAGAGTNPREPGEGDLVSNGSYIKPAKCKRCGHQWIPRKPGRPRRCPNPTCMTPNWDKPKPKKKR